VAGAGGVCICRRRSAGAFACRRVAAPGDSSAECYGFRFAEVFVIRPSFFRDGWCPGAVAASCRVHRPARDLRNQGQRACADLIRVTGMFWEKTAKYSIVAARMPDCMRRHAMSGRPGSMPGRGLFAGQRCVDSQAGKADVRGRDAHCEGFAKLDKEPDSGMGRALMGVFEMRKASWFSRLRSRPPPSPAAAPTAGESSD
jgi:hypothetical protein